MRAVRAMVILAFMCGGCTAPGGDLPSISEADTGAYRLGAGDRVRVTAFGLHDLSSEYVVGDTGRISVPLLGQVMAEGLTAEELEAELRRELDAGQIDRDANVSVQIERYRPFFILGEVREPGLYPYIPQMTLRTAVAVAGGYTYRADEKQAIVTRTLDDRVVEGRADSSTKIRPGDAIQIYERWF